MTTATATKRTRLAVLATLVAVGALAVTTAVASISKSSSISLRTTRVGKVLVAANGRTLYLFTADHGKKSTCYGQCATYWPPLIAKTPTAGTGLNVSLVGTTKRKDGRLQVTYGGHPLYYFVTDRKPGQTTGQGVNQFGGPWWVISPAGKEIHHG
jgi:predicted lipoprotein with Yx(FWY)xxD motif